MYFLKRLKRARLKTDDLVLFFKPAVLPVLEYTSAVWHSGLTQEQSIVLQAVQKIAMPIIYGAMSFKDACYFAKLVSLIERTAKEHFYQKCNT